MVFGKEGKTDPGKIKESASSLLRKIIKNPEFAIVCDGHKGTHSTRKYACTKARLCGCSEGEVNHRARWKGKKDQQDKYVNTTIPTIDGKVADKLCKGGCIFYHIKENSGITDGWIMDHVVPKITEVYGRGVAVPLGRALLWRIMDPEETNKVPVAIAKRVIEAYIVPATNLSKLEAGENPIAKVPLMIANNEGALILEPFYTEDHLTLNEDGTPKRIYEEDAVANQIRSRRNDNEEQSL